MRNHRCNSFMHSLLRSSADDPSDEAVRKMTAHAVCDTQESVATGISSMEYSDCIAALIKSVNLFANEGLHPPKRLGRLRCQNKYLSLHLSDAHPASLVSSWSA